MIIGVLSLQGAIEEHEKSLKNAASNLEIDIQIKRVVLHEDMINIDGLVMPGGESSAMRLIGGKNGMLKAVRDKIAEDLPVFGTCAGAILLSKEVKRNTNSELQEGAFPFLDIHILRNGYGRQADSFTMKMDIKNMDQPFPGVFIRAPRIERYGKKVNILASVRGDPVLVREKNKLASTFHPELTNDTRIHELFLRLVNDYLNSTN